jgi:hypothetical protein
MDSNPEEFVTGSKSGKWQHLLEKYEPYMNEEERAAVVAKYHALKMGKFTEAVMKELLEEREEVNLYGFGAAPVKGEGQPLTIADITNQTLKLLEGEFGLSFEESKKRRKK